MCGACTLENSEAASICEACETPRLDITLNPSLMRSAQLLEEGERGSREGMLEQMEVEAESGGEEPADNDGEEKLACSHCRTRDSTAGVDDILLCDGDGCTRGYHMRCLFPRLDLVPEEEWLCPICSSGMALPTARVGCPLLAAHCSLATDYCPLLVDRCRPATDH